MQFKIPQDVQRADRIVGPLTLRQLIIVGIGGGITYSLYTVLARQYFVEVWLLPVAFMCIITAAFAFYRFHDIAFERVVFLVLEYKLKARRRIWQKMKGDVFISILTQVQKKSDKKVQKKEELDIERRKKLAEITTML